MRRFTNEPSEEDLYLSSFEIYQKYKHLSKAELMHLQHRIMYFRAQREKEKQQMRLQQKAQDKKRLKEQQKADKELEEKILKVAEEQAAKEIEKAIREFFK